jgi:hypothetical protein
MVCVCRVTLTGLRFLMTQNPEAISMLNAKTVPTCTLESSLSAQLRDLPLHARTHLGESQAKFLRTAPAHRCTVDGERIACVLRDDTTLQLCSHGDGYETRNATAPRGEVSQLSVTGHSPLF